VNRPHPVNRSPAKARRGAALAVPMLAVVIIPAACSGHGEYTTEGISAAERRMQALKAATEYSMAEQAFLAGDLDKAAERLGLAIAFAPEVAINRVLLARVRLEQGRIGEALAELDRAIELDDTDAEARYYAGVVAERLQRTADAVEHFRAAAAAEPLDPQYTVAAAEALVDLRRYDEAERFLRDSEVHDHAPAVKQLLGHIAMIRGLHPEAADRFAEAALLAPEDDSIREDLAAALVAAGRFADADAEIARLLAAPVDASGSPQDAPAPRRGLLHLRGMCLIALGRPIEARRVYRTLSEGDRGASDIEAWVGLGRSAFLIGDERTLLHAARRASAVDPARPDGVVLLALHHRSTGDAEAALKAIDTFRGEPSTDLRSMRAMVLAELGRFDESRAELYAVLEHAPGNPAAMRLLDRLPERPLDSFATAPTE